MINVHGSRRHLLLKVAAQVRQAQDVDINDTRKIEDVNNKGLFSGNNDMRRRTNTIKDYDDLKTLSNNINSN